MNLYKTKTKRNSITGPCNGVKYVIADSVEDASTAVPLAHSIKLFHEDVILSEKIITQIKN
jgi:hypothetical protein